ncbi:MAG: hypothetical protein WDZ30_10660 [Cellvibrionaceae bacterium]
MASTIPGSSFWDRFKSTSTDLGDKPWLARREWASPVIKSEAKAVLWFAWIFALFWNAIAIPIAVAALPDILGGDAKALIVLLFPLAGMGLLAWAVTVTQAWRRFGHTPLTLDPFPGAVGGQVGGTLELPLPYDPNTLFSATLTCLYSYMTGSGKNRRRTERAVWQREGFAHTRAYGGKTRLEILFDVDDNLPASDVKKRSRYHLWRLQVEAKLPGADFDRSFEIPVFPTGEKAQQLRALSTEHASAAEQRMNAIEEVLDIRQIADGVELFYPAFRKPAASIFGLIGGAFFFATGLFIGYSGGPIVFPIFFPLMGGFLFVYCLYSLFVSLRVRLDGQHLQTDKYILGRRVGGETVPRTEVRCLTLKEGHSASSGNKHTVYYKLQAITHGGKRVAISRNLPGRDTANHALESLSLLTGVPGETHATSRNAVS